MDDAVHVEVESVELGHDVRELFDGLLIVIDLCVRYAHHLCEKLQINNNKPSLNRWTYIGIHPSISLMRRSTMLLIFILFLT